MPGSVSLHLRNVRGDRDALDTYYGPHDPSVGGDSDNRITLYSTLVKTYDNNDTGMAAAIAAAGSGDTILVPPGTLTNYYTIPADVAIVGDSIFDVIFSGEITLSDGSSLETLSIVRSESDAGAIYGIVEGAGGITATLKDIVVNVANDTGAAYAVFMANGGQIDAYNAVLYAETGSTGYAVYTTSGDFYHYGGRALGKVALTPYFS